MWGDRYHLPGRKVPSHRGRAKVIMLALDLWVLCALVQPKQGQVNPVRAGRGADPWGFCRGPKFRAVEVVAGYSIPEGDVFPLLPKMRHSECLGPAVLPSSSGLSAQAAWLRPKEQSQQGGQWFLPATPTRWSATALPCASPGEAAPG